MTPLRAALVLALVAAMTTSAEAQAAGSNWTRVQSLPVGEPIRVSGRLHRFAPGGPVRLQQCTFLSADQDGLRCDQTRHLLFIPITRHFTIARTDVHSVKLSRDTVSTLAGGALGAGAGAAAGAGIIAAHPRGDDPLGIAGYAIFGSIAGLAIGGITDFLAGPTIYREP